MTVALWSADYDRITGQALVTTRVRRQSGLAWQEHVYSGSGWRGVGSWLAAAFGLWKNVVLGRVTILYLVCSRSEGGFLRDIPALLPALLGVRTVVHAHGSDILALLADQPLSIVARALYRRCEIVVPSAHLLPPLRAITSGPLHLCENHLPAAAHQPVDLPSARTSTLIICWNSNVMASKGFFDLAGAVEGLAERGDAIKLVALGGVIADAEMDRQEATRRLAILRSHTWFDYRGPVAPDVAAAIVGRSDVVALPSRYSSECQPLALIQAMCAGKAIVAGDTAALRTTLNGYPARFVPPHATDALAEILAVLCREKEAGAMPCSSERRAASAVARRRFSPDRFDREMKAILEPAGVRA